MDARCADGPCKGDHVEVPEGAEPGFEFEHTCPDREGGAVIARYRLEDGGKAVFVESTEAP